MSPSLAVNKYKLKPLFISSENIIVATLMPIVVYGGSPVTNHRGKVIEHMLEYYNYIALNTGRPTCPKFRGGMSHIDLALVNSSIAAKCNWSVLNNTVGSDHFPTVVTYNEPLYSETTGIPRWKFDLADWQKYKHTININVVIVVYTMV